MYYQVAQENNLTSITVFFKKNNLVIK